MIDSISLTLRSILWTILLPGFFAGFLPWQYFGVKDVRLDFTDPTQVGALGLVGLGGGMLAWCIWEFAYRGKGTLAPVDAPRRLVVQGLYRYVRNPMYLSVSTIVLGEVLLTRSLALLLYWAVFFTAANLFVIGYEEPVLRRRFGDSYEAYARDVGRWVPRVRPCAQFGLDALSSQFTTATRGGRAVISLRAHAGRSRPAHPDRAIFQNQEALMRRRITPFSVPVLAAGLWACAADTPVVELEGECSAAYGAEVCSWAMVQGENVAEVGITVPLATIEGAPADAPMVMPPPAAAELDLPESVHAKAGMTEFTLFWEPHGHPPSTFMTPHFDFHFYNIPTAERLAIDCQDVSKPAELAAGYALPDEKLPPDIAKMVGTDVLIGICVPQMGMHSLLESELAATTTFRGTMVVGYWKTKPIFIEPMISKAMLLEKKSFDLAIPTVPGMTGPHPTVFRAVFDEASQSYRFTFSGFTTT